MQSITLQKKYLILVEIEENLYKLFLVIVNFIVNVTTGLITVANIVKEEILTLSYIMGDGVEDIKQKVKARIIKIYNYIKDIFHKLRVLLKHPAVYHNYAYSIISLNDYYIYNKSNSPPYLK